MFQGQTQVGISPPTHHPPPDQTGQRFHSLPLCTLSLKSVVILNNVPVSSGVHEFPILVQENKMGCVSAMFRYLSSKTDPGIKELLNYSFKIGVELP